MRNEDDAKESARKERHTPQTEKILRQFLTLESCNANSKTWRKNYDVAMKGSEKLAEPCRCDSCDYVANTLAEIKWHEERNAGHEIL